jgi:hypothetical protein
MVEFAVSVQSFRDLCLAEEPWLPFSRQNPMEAELQEVFFQEWAAAFAKPKRPERIYFGSEFCQYRLPPLSLVKKALAYCRESGFAFTFATPYAHREKFTQLVSILAYLDGAAASTGERVEVVVNDWGVYHHIQTHLPRLDVVIGRLLNKTIRDPRVAHYYANDKAPEEGRKFFQRTGLLSAWFQTFLQRGNVVGLDFDELIQGNEVPSMKEWEAPLLTSFHFPFGCVASGSACMVGFMETAKAGKFRGDPKCKQECQRYVCELKNRQHSDMQTRIVQKGTTAFYAHTRELVRSGLRGVQAVERPRVVYSPRIPV